MATKGVVRIKPLDDLEEEYFRKHPDEVDDYVNLIFDEFSKDNDLRSLLSSLRVLSRVRGISKIAEESGLSRRGVQKALSEKGNPGFGTVLAVLRGLGYRLIPKKNEKDESNKGVPHVH